MHAGEINSVENVLQAINYFDADRIGHCISVVDNDGVLDLLISRDICVELCIQSNYLTGGVKKIEQHPVNKFLSKGVPFVICSDNPSIHAFSLSQEYELFNRLTQRIDVLDTMNSIQKKYSFSN
ncbi:hypothetical protein CAP35_11860 [Chitinophagaceae bacterium IBVUCB1]|nr:hypothetical protein CAP35_11860 [Chitinophagaceae bacterium IBVUCB1]